MTTLAMRAAIGAALALCLAPAAGAADNAALTYWQAFALTARLDKAQLKVLAEHDKVKITEDVDRLLASCETSLRLMHRAAAKRHCDWAAALDEDGIHTMLPHLDRGRTLMRVAVLRARKRFEGGDARGGLADVTAALAMARHLGTDKTPLALLVQAANERWAVELAARHLPALGADGRKALVSHLDRLPAGATLKEALDVERRTTSKWLLGRLEAMRKDKPAVWRGKVLGLLAHPDYPGADERRKEVKKVLDDVGDGGPGKLIGYAKEIARTHDAIVRLADRSPAEAARELKPLLTGEAVRKNPLASLLLPGANYGVLWERDAEAKVRLALLKAAVAVQAGGAGDLKAHRDPYGKGPFAHKKVPGGFELSSALKVKDRPVSLRVGAR